MAGGAFRGWQLGAKQWRYQRYPAPRLVYNRISSRFLEGQSYNQRFFQQLARQSVYQMFNTRYINKQETFAVLSDYAEIQGLLPCTHPFSRGRLEEYLENFPEVFLKPSRSSRGEGIIKICRLRPGYYRYRRMRPGFRSYWHEGRTEEVVRRITALGGLRRNSGSAGLSAYILQEGIDLCRFQGRVFDIRAQAQKNGRGQWEMTGMGARLAAPKEFITHIPNGGRMKKIPEVLPPERCGPVKEETAALCLAAAPQLEKKLQLHLGVLSFDIGVDQTAGQVKLIEVNAKPAIFDETSIRLRHWDLLTDYFVYVLRRERNR
jgi:hypothetical protein